MDIKDHQEWRRGFDDGYRENPVAKETGEHYKSGFEAGRIDWTIDHGGSYVVRHHEEA